MFNGLWKYIAGILAALSAILGAALLYTGQQKERAKDAAKVAKARVRSVEAARDIERDIDERRAKVREKARTIRDDHKERPSDVPPSGNFRR